VEGSLGVGVWKEGNVIKGRGGCREVVVGGARVWNNVCVMPVVCVVPVVVCVCACVGGGVACGAACGGRGVSVVDVCNQMSCACVCSGSVAQVNRV